MYRGGTCCEITGTKAWLLDFIKIDNGPRKNKDKKQCFTRGRFFEIFCYRILLSKNRKKTNPFDFNSITN
jgi:hypothetical protein